ncbi:MAG: trigger factor [Lachnospiraceae bacterium]|nr:trigger factor [Lachnospiraceae bacterium]
MSLKVEKLEHNMAKLTIESGADELEKALQGAYQKQKGRINIPGFRKGKAPRQLIEKMYGPEVFYEDAANDLINTAYAKALEETDEEIVSRPQIEVVQIEKGKPFIFTAEVALKPEIQVGKYKGVKVEKINTEVKDAEIEDKLKEEQSRNARKVDVTDRAVKDGDIVNIDYSGSVDGEVFDGGTAKEQELEIGSHSFIDNFEDQIIGKNIGDDFDVNVTFPEDYHEKSLAGKPAVFKVKLNGIKENQMPELDDDFADEVSEFSTLKEYKEDIKKKLKEGKEEEAKRIKTDQALKAIVEDSEMDIPQAMIDTEAEQLVQNFANRFRQQGFTLQQYMQFTGMTADKLREDMAAQAKINIESRLVLEAVAKAEKIEATEEELDKELESMAAQYRIEKDKIREILGEEEVKNIRQNLAMQKAADFIVDNSKEDAKKKAEIPEDGEVIEKKAAPKKRSAKKKEEAKED